MLVNGGTGFRHTDASRLLSRYSSCDNECGGLGWAGVLKMQHDWIQLFMGLSDVSVVYWKNPLSKDTWIRAGLVQKGRMQLPYFLPFVVGYQCRQALLMCMVETCADGICRPRIRSFDSPPQF